jgi:S-layer homology domain
MDMRIGNLNQNNTLIEIIVLSAYLLDQVVGGVMNFRDTISGAWYERFIAFAQRQLFVEGYLDANGISTGFFGPQNNITRAEAAKIITNVKQW